MDLASVATGSAIQALSLLCSLAPGDTSGTSSEVIAGEGVVFTNSTLSPLKY